MSTKQPFALIGAGRSGSSYLHWILCEHPRIAMTNEGKLVDFAIASMQFARTPAYQAIPELGMQGMCNQDYIPRFCPAFEKHTRLALEEFYAAQWPDKDFTHWGDKMVSPHSARGLVEFFPDMKLVVNVRDVRDQVCSQMRFVKHESLQEIFRDLQDWTPKQHAQHWHGIYADLLQNLPGYHLVRYEEVMADPRREVERILDFLGLEFTQEVADAIANNDTFQGHAASSSPEASIGKWRNELSEEGLADIEALCGDLMRHMGYSFP